MLKLRRRSWLNALAATLIVVFTAASPASAQKPQYAKKNSGTAWRGQYWCLFNPASDTTPARRFQFIYQPNKHFPGAPGGYIKAIYFRSGYGLNNAKFYNPGFAYNISIRMGWTARDTFRHLNQNNPSLRDTFIADLTTVGSMPVVRQNLRDSPTVWMKFPLTGQGFYYNPAIGLNLVVELVLGPPFIKNYFCLVDSAGDGAWQFLSGYRDTAWVSATLWSPLVGAGQSYDFGFDLTPAGVEAGSFGGSFSLFPNPAKGSFRITADAEQPIQHVVVTVHSVTGQTVFRQFYKPMSASFSAELRLPDGLAKGVYMVEVIADGERIVRRISLE